VAQRSKIMVVKIGSSTLVDEKGVLDRAYLDGLAAQMEEVRALGWKLIVVTSGAIACALPVLGFEKRPSDMPTLQAAASVGQNVLMSGYADVFVEHGLLTSVILLTRATTADRSSYLHARDTLLRLLELDVIPVVNENDTLSTEQIKFGDNDTLAALVACLVNADLCVLFSDIDGLYTANPNTDPTAQLIQRVERITPEIRGAAGGVGSSVGSGGMVTKIRAARVLMAAGIQMVICHGRQGAPLPLLARGEAVGTSFVTAGHAHEVTPKKLWIALGDKSKGALIVDEGAKRALIERGSSLLAVGISSVEGSFASGDVIDVRDASGYLFARGLARASSAEVELACGRTQQQIRDNELLRNLANNPVIHRDELIVFE
jgi:glutamate 5-kinase